MQKVLIVLPKYGAINALSFLQRKKYIQTYVTFRPDGHKISPISGDVLYGQQVSEYRKPETWSTARLQKLIIFST